MRKNLRPFGRNTTQHARSRAGVLLAASHQVDALDRASMSKVVQDSSFWQLPGKVAVMIEQQARQHALQCKTRLQDQAEENEHSLARWWEESHRLYLERLKISPPPPAPLRILTSKEAKALREKHAEKLRLKRERHRRRAKATKTKKEGRVGGKAAQPAQPEGREECFTVYEPQVAPDKVARDRPVPS